MSNVPTTSASDTVRSRRLLVLGILLILAALVITAGRLIHSRMQEARLVQDRPADLQYGVKVYSPETGGNVQTQRQKYLAKASLMRDHWRVWALAHRDSLRQLRQAPPGDSAAMMRFYAALLGFSGLSQAMQADVGIRPADINNERAVRFTWNSRPPTTGTGRGSDDAFFAMMERGYTRYHGVAISNSVSAGRSRITLWDDGRITEMTRLPHPALGQRDEGPEKEIAPPYDFLK